MNTPTRSGKSKSAESAKQEIKGSYGEGFVIMGTDRVEVSPDGKKLTTYTNESVETKSASGAATQGISISADFHTVVLNGATIERAADGHLVISSSGTVLIKPGPANDTAAKAKTAPEIGEEMQDGTILAGYYEGKPLYATPRDAPGAYTFNKAANTRQTSTRTATMISACRAKAN